VRETGDWESWLEFFLEGVTETAGQAIKTAKNILQLFTQYRQKIESLGRPAVSALIVYHYLEKHSITDIGKIAKHCKIPIPTVTKSIQYLEELKIVQ